MKKYLFYALFIAHCLNSAAQLSVFECDNALSITPRILPLDTLKKKAFNGEYYQPCAELNDKSYINYGGNALHLKTSEKIELSNGLTIDNITSGGSLVLSVEKSPLDVVYYDYGDLNSIEKNKKIEFGVKMPEEFQLKINNFLTKNLGDLDISDPNNELNPFMEWDVKVVCEFHTFGSFYKSVDGFYYRNMVHDVPNNTWKDEGTDYPFRMRFSPPTIGKWSCIVKIFIKGQYKGESLPFHFNVVETGAPGYVKVHPNKKQFERDGEVIMPIGQNLPWPTGESAELADYTHDPDFINKYPLHVWSQYTDRIQKFADEDGKYLRILTFPGHADIEFEKLGNYYDRLKFANEMDNLLNICEDENVLIDFNLMMHSPIMRAADSGHYAWDYGSYFITQFDHTKHPPVPVNPSFQFNGPVYCYAKEFQSDLPSNMFLNESSLQYVKQRYRYFISRYGYSTAVYIFELLSEPFHMNEEIEETIVTDFTADTAYAKQTAIQPYYDDNGNIGIDARKAVEKFHYDVSDYIKNTLAHTEHLIGINGNPGFPVPYPHSLARPYLDKSWSCPTIDVVGLSYYPFEMTDNMFINKNEITGHNDNIKFPNPPDGNKENNIACTFYGMRNTHPNKLFYISEFGDPIDSLDGQCWMESMAPIHLTRLSFSGLAGFNIWGGHSYFKYDNSFIWEDVKRSEEFINRYKVILGSDWIQGRQHDNSNPLGEKDIELQYLLNSSGERCVGYIYNRHFNNDNLVCIPTKEGKYPGYRNIKHTEVGIELHGLLENKNYRIIWYNELGNQIDSDFFNSNSAGQQELKFPDLQSNKDINGFLPLVLFEAYVDDCMNGIVEGNPNQLNSPNEHIDTRIDLEKETNSMGISKPSVSNHQIQHISITPNPSNGEFHIKSESQIGAYSLFDMNGKKLFSGEEISRDLIINLQKYQQGMYLLDLNDNHGHYKLIKAN